MQKENADKALNALLESKNLFNDMTDTEKIVKTCNASPCKLEFELEEYKMQDGVPAYYIHNFDNDGSEEVFTTVENNN